MGRCAANDDQRRNGREREHDDDDGRTGSSDRARRGEHSASELRKQRRRADHPHGTIHRSLRIDPVEHAGSGRESFEQQLE